MDCTRCRHKYKPRFIIDTIEKFENRINRFKCKDVVLVFEGKAYSVVTFRVVNFGYGIYGENDLQSWEKPLKLNDIKKAFGEDVRDRDLMVHIERGKYPDDESIWCGITEFKRKGDKLLIKVERE